MSKTILILGGGIMQLPAIRIAKKMGWKVILADGNSDVQGKKLADCFMHVDLKEKDEMLKAAAKYHARGDLDGIFTAGTDFSTTVAWVAENLDLPGISYEVALKASNKKKMRECLQKNGVPSPPFTVFHKSDTKYTLPSGLIFPLVVKPVDNMGSRGVRRINNEKSLREAVKDAFFYSATGEAIVEKLVEGPEFSIDAIVYKGEITICGLADRHIYFPPYFVEMGHTMPSTVAPDLQKNLINTFKEGVRAIGITNGSAKGDVKLSINGPVIGEIAARLSGGYMSGWTYPMHSGVEVTQAALKIAVGDAPGELKPLYQKVSAERAFISIPGRIEKLKGLEAAENISGVRNVFCGTKEGCDVEFPQNNVQKCGNIISCHDQRQAAEESAEKGCAVISILLTPGVRTTEDFLLKQKNKKVPDAYSLKISANSDAFENMSPYKETDDGFYIRSILSLPEMYNERGKDWNHISFSNGIEKVKEETQCLFIPFPENGEGYLGKIFWKAYLRGGYQGGIWFLKTIGSLIRDKGAMERFLRLWE